MKLPSYCIVCANASPVKKELNALSMLQCERCGLVWRDGYELSDDHYENDPMALDPQKLESRRRNVEDRIRTLAAHTDLNWLCDIGAGEGAFVAVLLGRGYKGAFGLDPNTESVDFAEKKRIPVYKGVLDDVGSYAKQMPIRSVSMFHVIEHLSRPDRDVRTIWSVLPAGGRLIIETPNLSAYSFKASGYRNKLIYDAHLYYFNETNLAQLLTNAGFKVVAYGRRDFDEYHLPIAAVLNRLGWHPYGARPVSRLKRLLFRPFGPLLRRIVIMLGRLDYMWFIAEKAS